MNDLSADLSDIVTRHAYWSSLRGQRLLVTGATGFFGIWLLESFAKANAELNLQAELVALSRDPAAFVAVAPHLAKHPAILWIKGDVRDFAFPEGRFDYVLHGAMTTAAETFHKTQSPLDKYDLVVDGTRRVLDLAVHAGVRKLLLLSSGPTYGRQPYDMNQITEDYCGAPLTTDRQFDFSVLGEAKRVAELLSTVYAEQHGLQVAIARCFSFVGPYLPLDLHYAIGNFIDNALRGQPIIVRGDGTTLRSYQYISDTMIWLWTLLLADAQGLFNVGSDQACSIGELAQRVAQLSDSKQPVVIEQTPKTGVSPIRYVPSIAKAKHQLGLQNRIDLDAAISKTLDFYRKHYE